MKIFLFLFTGLLCAAGSDAQKQLVIDPNAVVREMSGSFNSVRVSGSIHLYFSKSQTNELAVSDSEGGSAEAIKTVVANNVLNITSNLKGASKSGTLSVYLGYKTLDILNLANSAVAVSAGEIQQSSLSINLDNSSSCKANLKVDKLSVDMSNSSTADLSGSTGKVVVVMRNSSVLRAFELTADKTDVEISNSVVMEIGESQKLRAAVSNSAQLSYKGSPATEITLENSGTAKRIQ